MAYTRPLAAVEARILGALMEKERTTPDLYPLTVSALLQACNQKTSREPVTDYSETAVVEALDRLRADALVFRVHGSRSERYEHCLDRRWHLDTAGAAAVIAMLLLRGAQTVAELRARTARLHPFATAEQVEATLARLAAGEDALARELPRQPGQRETRWIHLAGTAEVERDLMAGGHRLDISAPDDGQRASEPRQRTAENGAFGERLERLEAAVAEITEALAELRARFGD
ncbi:MAG: YceH family protein [Thermoanaerobaculia bacterium]